MRSGHLLLDINVPTDTFNFVVAVMNMINLFEVCYVNWIDYLNDVFCFDWYAGVNQDDLSVACHYFYFG